MRYQISIGKAINAALVALLLTGCFDSTSKQPVLREYLERIASVQDEDPPPSPNNQPIELPDKRELLQPLPRITVGLIDSYQLNHCGLFQLIAQKNSILGKVGDQFSNFDYQIRFLVGVQSCLLDEQLEPELHAQLLKIQQQKEKQIHVHFFHLIYASDAMRQQLSGSAWLSSEDKLSTQMIKPALVQLATIQQDLIDKPYLEKNYQIKEVSGYQETLEKVSLLGKLTYSLHMTTQWLNITTDQLYKYDNKIRCGRNADTTKFKYLVNVFNRYYVNDLQPYVSFLDRQYQLVDKQLVVFEPHHLSDTLPDVIYPLAQYYSMFKTANQNHVRYWAQLFKRCNTSVQTILKQ